MGLTAQLRGTRCYVAWRAALTERLNSLCPTRALEYSEVSFDLLIFLLGDFAFCISLLQDIQGRFRFLPFALAITPAIHPGRPETPPPKNQKHDLWH